MATVQQLTIQDDSRPSGSPRPVAMNHFTPKQVSSNDIESNSMESFPDSERIDPLQHDAKSWKRVQGVTDRYDNSGNVLSKQCRSWKIDTPTASSQD